MELRLTALSAEMEFGTVLGWHRQEGEAVEAGEPLVEVEAEKATYELESPVAGVLTRIVAVEGDELRVGGLLGIIDEPASSQRRASAEGRRT